MRLLFVATLTLVATSAFADIEEVIVTADFHQTREMDLPESVSVIGRETIKSRAAQHLEEILGNVPNLNL